MFFSGKTKRTRTKRARPDQSALQLGSEKVNPTKPCEKSRRFPKYFPVSDEKELRASHDSRLSSVHRFVVILIERS